MKKTFFAAILCLIKAGHIPPLKRHLSRKNSMLLFPILGMLLSVVTFAQNPVTAKNLKTYQVTGLVTDSALAPLQGASVTVKNNKLIGTSTDQNGKFILDVPEKSILVFSFLNYESKEITLTGEKSITVSLGPAVAKENDAVVVVAYGTQKKTSLVSSITTIEPKALKGPTSNMTQMLAGRVPGIISFQRSGEPGQDNASFFIRGVGTFGAGKVGPLILIDGIESEENSLARLQPDDIAGFSILKDATASSLYGARGANGVILVTTKQGQSGKVKFNARVENSNSSNSQNLKFADNITYMTLANEGVLTRDPLGVLPYSQNKIDHTANGDNPLLYPSNDWLKQLLKKSTNNQRFNINAGGGGEKARYYLAMTYNRDNGILQNNSTNSFDNNVKFQSYSLLSNTTLNVTKSTEVTVSLKGQFDSYHGPIGGGSAVFANSIWSNPVQFPAVYPASYLPYVKHPLFGNKLIPNSGGRYYVNPYAEMVSGFQQTTTSNLNAQLTIKQNLDFITTGLSARAMAYTMRYSNFSTLRKYFPYYYTAFTENGKDISQLAVLNDNDPNAPNAPTEYLNYGRAGSSANGTSYIETALNYSRVFNTKHAVTGLLIGTMRNYLTADAPSLQLSLPSRNLGTSGRFTYGYDSRYLVEFDFGYNGSERFAANHRYGFFPSVGGGWVVSNEKFFAPVAKTINELKFRFTYGLVGNDQIGNSNDRFFYLSDVTLNAGISPAFGTDLNYGRNGVRINRYENSDITWETSKQLNYGMDLKLFNSLTVTVDAYKQVRSQILLSRSTLPTSLGLNATTSANTGKASSEGVDIALNYNKNLSKSAWVQARATLTYATSKVLINEEPNFSSTESYLSHVGYSVNQPYGLIAERLFVDDEEVANSPHQNFGEYLGGDIKYRDLNGDGQITGKDIAPIGHPYFPELIFGAGFTAGYKGFELSAFFQGSARSSLILNPSNITPFYSNGPYQNGLLKVIADDHWSEDNRNAYAFWPRLSNTIQGNNAQNSTWWMYDNSFIRLKSAELAYNLPQPMLRKISMSNVRIYVNGTNLFLISKFKLWDPEMGNNPLAYPIQRVVNLGVNIGF